jgi:D-glycero-alpha-D-manno-heptose-7-phosphate kinase
MIVTSCPLRISIVGGSTDHPLFIDKYLKGSVISFPSSLRVYISVHKDIFGTNSLDNNYQINYSKKETVKKISDIQNELVRECFEYLNVERINCSLVSDIYSSGSGLASSSAYLQALIKCIYIHNNKEINDIEVCKLAEKIEKKFNPLVGQQDFYGSLGGLKRINFFKNDDPEIKYLDQNILNLMDIYLLHTGVQRESTKVLETLDIDKALPLLQDVNDLEISIKNYDLEGFNCIVNRSWINKKETSDFICNNPDLILLDEKLTLDKNILSHKLCGAGNGGYFLIFTKKDVNIYNNYSNKKLIKVSVSNIGLKNYI